MSLGTAQSIIKLLGTDKNDVLTAKSILGTASPYSIFGFGGNDTLTGAAGNDTLTGGAGNDVLAGREGNDELHGGKGYDYITGGVGNDVLYSGSGGGTVDDNLFGGAGNDVLIANDMSWLIGGADKDIFVFGRGSEGIVQWAGSAIGDFEHGVDKIDISAFGVTSMNSVHVSPATGTTHALLITLDAQGITLDAQGKAIPPLFDIEFGQHQVHLDASDFIFAPSTHV